MVLINALDETIDSLYGEDKGIYLEERMIIKQMGKYIDLVSIYEPLKNHLKSGVKKELLIPELKKRYSDALWLSLLEKFYNIIPDKQMAESFKNTFEEKKQEKNNRLAILQNHNITYFFEDLSQKIGSGEYNEEYVDLLKKEFEGYLIHPESFVLEDPDMSLGLEDSIELFKSKYEEQKNIKSVK